MFNIKFNSLDDGLKYGQCYPFYQFIDKINDVETHVNNIKKIEEDLYNGRSVVVPTLSEIKLPSMEVICNALEKSRNESK